MRFTFIGAVFLLSAVNFFLTGVSSQTITKPDLETEMRRPPKAPDLEMLASAVKDDTGHDLNASPNSTLSKLTGSVSEENTFFGIDVAIDGDTAVIGAYNERVGPYRSGAVYVYVWNGSSWGLQQKLFPHVSSSTEDFGYSVAISGDTIIVGAPDYSENASIGLCGRVYIFQRNGTTWTEQQRVVASDRQSLDWYGRDVSISGDTAIVGSRSHPVNFTTPGAAYFLQRTGSVWTEVQKVTHGGNTNDLFGYSVAVDGDTAAVGFPRYAGNTGGVCVYDRNGGAWVLTECRLPDEPNQGCFGESVSVSGSSLLVGAPCSQPGSIGGAGYVFVKEGNGGWQQQAKLTAPDAASGDGLGVGGEIDGDRVILGAWVNNGSRGAGYSFVRCLNDWGYEEKFVASDGAPGDNFGRRVALSGSKVVFGSPFAEIGGIDDQGAAYTVVIGSDLCDISIIVNRTTDESDDDIDDDVCDIDENTLEQECTLRAAIETANARAGRDIITFDIPGAGTKTISPGSTLPLIVDPITINAATQPGYANSPLIQLVGGSGANPALGLVGGSDDSRIKGLSITGFETGIAIHSWGNSIESCYLGLKADGTAPTSGQQAFGAVLVNGASNNIIGGTDAIEGNTIGNLSVGIGFFGGAGSNRVLNNKIGTNAAGNTSMPNEVGVLINGGNSNKIGEAGDGNLISGNLYGVEIYNASATFVRGNNIGTDASGTAAIPNYIGVVIEFAGNNKVGDVTTADGNLISGNEAYGVALFSNTANNLIAGNRIGTKANGNEELGNGAYGIIISEGANANTIDNNVIGGHTLALQAGGIVITSDAGTANRMIDNHIGVVRGGTNGIPNNTGIKIFADGQIVGEQGHPNLICNSEEAGVVIAGNSSTDATGNFVQYNDIGTDGTQSIGEQTIGVVVAGASANTVQFNIISNNEAGVAIVDGSSENTVNNNKIGTAANGITPLPNLLGVTIEASQNNTIKDNLVSGNENGISIGDSAEITSSKGVLLRATIGRLSPSGTSTYATGNKLSGNIVGLNADQSAPVLSGVGIWVGQNARANFVGTTDGNRNVIAGNSSYGVVVGTFASNPPEDVRPRDNKVQRNLIGISENEVTFPNSVGVVLSQTSGNTIGGLTDDLQNVIAASTLDGIAVGNGSNYNILSYNRIGVVGPSQFHANSPGRTIGGASPGNLGSGIKITGRAIANTIRNNIIGNNGRHGIEIESPEAPAAEDEPTLITGNNIGVMADQVGSGIADIGNILSGISIKNTTNVQIGAAGEINANVIGKNREHGIKIVGNPTSGAALPQKGIKAMNNLLGMIRNDQDEPLAAGNAFNGLYAQNFTGLEVGGDVAELANKIVAKGRAGLLFKLVNPTAEHPIAVRVRGNSIGAIADALGNITSHLGNLAGGIETEDSSAVEIGSVDETVPPNLVASNLSFGFKAKGMRAATLVRNMFIKNQGPGVHLYQSTEMSVIGNGIGLALGADIANSGNIGDGVLIEESPGNTIGGTEVETFNKIGKQLQNAAIHYLNTHPGPGVPNGGDVKGNLLGGRTTAFGGTVARASNKVAVLIENSSSVTIGGLEPEAANSVVASAGPGVKLKGAGTRFVSLINNVIGAVADHHGTSTDPMGNDEDGVIFEDGASDNTVGGDGAQLRSVKQLGTSTPGNTITANGRNGILLAPSAGNNNRLGGNNIFGNVRYGIDLGNDGVSPNDPLDADSGPNNLQNYPEIMSTQVVNNDLIVNFRLDSAPENSAYGMNGIFIEFFKANASGEGERFIGSTRYTLGDYNSLIPGIKTVNLGDLATLGINGTDALTSTATDANGNTSEFTPRFGPTSAGVTVSGRVTTASGAGLRNAIVSITDLLGNQRSAVTGSFGYYKFEEVPAGETYVVAVTSKRFDFTPRIVTIGESVTDLDFEGSEIAK